MSELTYPKTGGKLSVDLQALEPDTSLSLSRVGVTGVEKIIRLHHDGQEQLFYAELECSVDLNPRQTAAHMSRFAEVVNETIDEVVLGEAFRAEMLATRIAECVRTRQQGRRAEVTITARYPEHKTTPRSKMPTQELYSLISTAVSNENGLRYLVGVQAQGITACPCAQTLAAEGARERLIEDGFSEEEVERVLALVPVATHNQRGIGTLHVGCTPGSQQTVDARTLLRVIESSMSSEIYELLKRPDELAVVDEAHRRPRFVEDCVRGMVKGAIDAHPRLGDGAFIQAHQENLETIHRHSVFAERHGTVGELRHELESRDHVPRHTTRREWLEEKAG